MDNPQASVSFLTSGPFQLLTTGKDKSFVVSVASFSQFIGESKKYKSTIPLQFLNHAYGIRHIEVVDSASEPGFHVAEGTSGHVIKASRTRDYI